MSRVTNVVVHVAYAPKEAHASLRARLTDMPYVMIAGPKVFEDDLYVGTFNYLEVGKFIKWFTGLEWGETGNAVLSLNVEGEEYCVAIIRDGRILHELVWAS